MFNAMNDEARRQVSLDLPEWIKIGLAGVALVWGWLAPLDQLLVLLIVLDIVSGILCAGISGKINSDASFKGMMKKTLILLLVVMAHVIDPHAGELLGFAQIQISFGNMVAAFFCTTEFVSITENAANAGVPIPKVFRDALEKVNR